MGDRRDLDDHGDREWLIQSSFEKIPELLTRGHHVNEKRLGQYVILPTKYYFTKVVRIMSIVTGFVSKLRKGRKMIGHLLAEGKMRFTVFQAVMDSYVLVADGDDHPL
jgi:hypothetical protein